MTRRHFGRHPFEWIQARHSCAEKLNDGRDKKSDKFSILDLLVIEKAKFVRHTQQHDMVWLWAGKSACAGLWLSCSEQLAPLTAAGTAQPAGENREQFAEQDPLRQRPRGGP
jgi:hypothetical protein